MMALRTVVAVAGIAVLADSSRCAPDDPRNPAPAEPAIFAARRRGTGDASADATLKAALDWLARHQVVAGPDAGAWTLDAFPKRCVGRRCGGAGIDYAGRAGPTALALLAFLGAGETQTVGDHHDAVAKALASVAASQDSDGCFGPRTFQAFLVAHATAMSAVAEAYQATRDPALLQRLTRARDFLLRAQDADSGWRYGTGRDDTFMTATASLALRAVEFAGVDVPKSAGDGALAWLDGVTDADGRAGYATRGGGDARLVRVVADPSAAPPTIRGFETEAAGTTDRRSAMSAAAALVRALWGADPALVDAGAQFVASSPAADRGVVDLHCALFGSALFAQTGGGGAWRKSVVEALVAAQRSAADGCAAGSFDPSLDPWGAVGGRVYATAMAALVLEAPGRWPRVFDARTKKPGSTKK
jgi:hypothetical protein